MPAKPLSKRERLARRRRWREIVTWAFDDNLTMAADLLRLPYSTARLYQSEGPRRLKPDVLFRLGVLTGLGGWLLGIADQEQPNSHLPRSLDNEDYFGESILPFDTEPLPDTDYCRLWLYRIPKCLRWRLERLRCALMDRMDDTASEVTRALWAMQAVVEPILVGVASGLLDAEPYGLQRTRRIHRLAAYWEDEIGIGRPTFDTTDVPSPPWSTPTHPEE